MNRMSSGRMTVIPADDCPGGTKVNDAVFSVPASFHMGIEF
jgi:hypothetical protein